MVHIRSLKGRQILDSRGNPTLEVEVSTDTHTARAAVPSGASTGSHEAHELRDGGTAYGGKGVTKAIENVQKIASHIAQMDIREQEQIDAAMVQLDGTKNKSNLGANTILGISMAIAKCAAMHAQLPLYKYLQKLMGNANLRLPIPFANLINGGVHAPGGLPFQEIMVVPTKATSFQDAVQMVAEIDQAFKTLLQEHGDSTLVGDEGGFVPHVDTPEKALDLLMEAIHAAKYTGKVHIALDAAASEFLQDGMYQLHVPMTGKQLAEYYMSLVEKYPIISIEDPFGEDDLSVWAHFMDICPIQVVGDDLLVTNPKRIDMAKEQHLCNALLLKVNQIGTVTEALHAAKSAFQSNWNVMVSHRSGETEDTFIADLAVALGCGQIKIGAPCRGERTAKYNQLLRIEEETQCPYATFDQYSKS